MIDLLLITVALFASFGAGLIVGVLLLPARIEGLPVRDPVLKAMTGAYLRIVQGADKLLAAVDQRAATVSERTEPVVVRVDRRTWKEVRA